MVFRKPFAFIIKHFKAFHVVMFLTTLFIMYNANQIRSLIRSLISQNAFTYAGAENYTNSPVFIVCLIGLTAVGLIYWLFTVRKKDLKYYSLVIGYYAFSMGGFYYLFDKINILAQKDVSIDELNLIRDVSTLILLVSVPILIMSLIRSIGFNIKQFNFSKDIKELEITDKDSEEFEILIGQNNYKYFRKIRKTIRETRYAILEHLFIITIAVAGVVIVGAVSFGYKYYKDHKVVANSEISTVNGVYYVVNNTYVTARNLNGKQIKSNSKYVIVNISMKNMTSTEKLVDLNVFSIQTGRLIYRPITFLQSEFNDLGVYIKDKTVIPNDSFLTGIIIFEIPLSMNVSNFTLKVFKDYKASKDEFTFNFEKFAANGYILDEDIKEEEIEIGTKYDSALFRDNKVNFSINKAYLADAFNDKYVICETEDKCITKTQLIKPEKLTNNTMLVVDYAGSVNSDASYYAAINDMDSFFNSFSHVEYVVGVEKFSSNGEVIRTDINGKAFILLDRKATKASKIDLVFNFRNSTIKIPIK